MIDFSSLPEAATIALIFVLRGLNLTLATMRLLSVVRGRIASAWLLAFVQSFFFLTTVAGVMENADSLANILAYAGGYATGLLVGISLESRIAPGYTLLRLISTSRGEQLLEAIHRSGYGATILSGKGLKGMVSMILCYAPRKQSRKIVEQAETVDPDVFITSEYVRRHSGGWL